MVIIKAKKRHSQPTPVIDKGLGTKVVITPENAARLGFEIIGDYNEQLGMWPCRRLSSKYLSTGYFSDYPVPETENPMQISDLEKRALNTKPNIKIILPDGSLWDIMNETLASLRLNGSGFSFLSYTPGVYQFIEDEIQAQIEDLHYAAQTRQISILKRFENFNIMIGNQIVFDSLYQAKFEINVNNDPNVPLQFYFQKANGWAGHLFIGNLSKSSDYVFQFVAVDLFPARAINRYLLAAGTFDSASPMTGLNHFLPFDFEQEFGMHLLKK